MREPRDTYKGPERRARADEDSWHLDKKVPISIILALLGYGVTGLWAFADSKKDIEILKVSTAEQRERDKRQDDQMAQAVSLVRSQLERMENKMDRVLETRQRP